MINYFGLPGLTSAFHQMWWEESRASERARLDRINPIDPADLSKIEVIGPADVARAEMLVNNVGLQGRLLEIEAVDEQASRLLRKLRSNHIELAEYASEIRGLRETFEAGLRFVRVYKYPKQKIRFLLDAQFVWQRTMTAFPETKPEIEAAVDCYALGHNTACVFHMMRVAEVGLRALASERGVTTVQKGKPLEWGTWKEVVDAINKKLDNGQGAIRQRTAGPARDAALAFYNAALTDIRALQDLYRDRTFHLRESYDEEQAQSAMIRARQFTEVLASRLDTQSAGPIDWGF